MKSHGVRQSKLPITTVMVLMVASFLFGHYTHRPIIALPPQQGEPVDVAATAPRKLQASATEGEGVQMLMDEQRAAVTAPSRVHPPQDAAIAPELVLSNPSQVSAPGSQELPLADAFAQQYLDQSGMSRLRPPLLPASSGDNFTSIIPYQILSWYPRIVVLPNFIDKARCDHIIKIATRKVMPSGLAFRPDETPDENQQTRTSLGTFLSRQEDRDGVLGWIEEKVARFTLLPVSHGEAFNVLRYENLQHYDSHMDTFDPKDFGPQATQRVATLLFYLSDVEEGGETVFKREGKDAADKEITDWRSCDENEFKYKPRLGDAVLFYSVDPDLTINPRSLHGGCPVKKGVKWVATKWLHDKPIRSGLW